MSTLLATRPLGFQWVTLDPFLFCVHHNDAYPKGNAELGPAASLRGRRIGMDFEGVDGWRMYHGERIPGFPQHPHRGFETVTIVRTGYVDHSDSLGATARFGEGDVQWLTAGKGILHSEMFPLLREDRDNPLELFQIWLNLPRASKMVDPHFSMFWKERIPVVERDGAALTLIAGAYDEARPLPPPPSSRAAQPGADLAIWLLRLAPGARFTLPPAQAGSNRLLYFFQGEQAQFDGIAQASGQALAVQPDRALPILNGAKPAELLMLQGRPIGEPVAQQGPFVMNTAAEIQQAFLDYQRTRFGGWPWKSSGPVHAREAGRFARHVDGRVEEAG